MDTSKEKHYFTIDYENNEITEVFIYTDEFLSLMEENIKKFPELKDAGFTNKFNMIKRNIYYKDQSLINAKKEEDFLDAIESSDIIIDLEKFTVHTKYKLYNKKKSKLIVNTSTKKQCLFKK